MQPEPDKIRQTRAWLTKARVDLAMADRAMQTPPLLDAAVYHCQQVAEKALKAFLLWNDTPFARTHDLRDLVSQCESIDYSYRALASAADILFPYATQFRYPGAMDVPQLIEAQEALRLAQQVVAFVVQRLPSSTHP